MGKSRRNIHSGESKVRRNSPSSAAGNARGVHWNADGAGAISDGQGSGFSDGVGVGAIGDLGGGRTVGGVGGDDLGGVGDIAVGMGRAGAIMSRSSCGKGEESGAG